MFEYLNYKDCENLNSLFKELCVIGTNTQHTPKKSDFFQMLKSLFLKVPEEIRCKFFESCYRVSIYISHIIKYIFEYITKVKHDFVLYHYSTTI